MMQVSASFTTDARQRVLWGSSIQAVVAFILPCFMTWSLTSGNPMSEMEVNRIPDFRNIFGILLLYIVALPAMNQIILWNQSMSLPESMSGFEQMLRSWEEAGEKSTSAIINVHSVGALIVNILIIGVLTGIAEEIFFRAGIQRLFIKSGFGPTISIWVTALIFSIVHFQFFGFVPRLLLGAAFGYIYYWTRSIWNSIFAHAFNNSLVVLTGWLTANGSTFDFDTLGVTTQGFPYIFLISVVITALFIWKGRHYFFSPSDN